jgi:tankyrase
MADTQTSFIEEKYPRICQQLALMWGHPELEKWFEKMWIDDRGTRQGFPPEVMSELMFVSSLHQVAYPTLGPQFANRAIDTVGKRF